MVEVGTPTIFEKYMDRKSIEGYWPNMGSLDRSSLAACLSWAEGAVSVLFDSMTNTSAEFCGSPV